MSTNWSLEHLCCLQPVLTDYWVKSLKTFNLPQWSSLMTWFIWSWSSGSADACSLAIIQSSIHPEFISFMAPRFLPRFHPGEFRNCFPVAMETALWWSEQKQSSLLTEERPFDWVHSEFFQLLRSSWAPAPWRISVLISSRHKWSSSRQITQDHCREIWRKDDSVCLL